MKIEIEFTEEEVNLLNQHFKNFTTVPEEIIKSFILEQVQQIVVFENGFTFDKTHGILKHKEKQIQLSEMEVKLFNCLLKRENQIVSLEIIFEEVKKGRPMSIFALRNVIKKIRDKTYYEIIQNISSVGYKIQTL